MNGAISPRRIIVCIDGVNEQSNILLQTNASNILRLKSAIEVGQCVDTFGRSVHQIVHYHAATVTGSALSAKFSSKTTTASEQQIQDIVLNICRDIEDPQDEVFLFGSGHGAYTARAVAGVLHHMGVPRHCFLQDFPELYKKALELYKARQQDDSRKGGKALEYLRTHTNGAPNIQFVGLLESVKSPADKQLHDVSVVSSIRHFRHAMAFNENRSSNALDMPQAPAAKEMEGRTFVQAWFLGYHPDILGGVQHDGLSLYPLQWIFIESMLHGLVVGMGISGKRTLALRENPLAFAFPQYAGGVPDLSGKEKIQWQIQYTNSVHVSMFDLQSTHVAVANAEEPSHAIHLETVHQLYNSPRKIFTSKDDLIGWDKLTSASTIIHPSVFCILDRNQRFFEQPRFKPYKEALADFETNCMQGDSSGMPPWLEDSQLLASGVKAFRILVCGKTGVGKSTLINKIFGVEMTEESNTYAQGNHDINQAFESPNHPGLLIHDSRGWQAGSDQELDLVARFLRYRAFQKDPAEALHVIWFCVDSDVSRIEEADKRTFETIAQYSNHVPVFVVGTKKDKLVMYRQMQLLEQYMEKTNDYQESKRLAAIEADNLAQEQFLALRDQLSQIKSYKADGYVCLSKDDDSGVKSLLTQTLDMITDERVRIYCVAAQVVDVEQKIDSAISECMRLGTHAIRTAMVPLPFTGSIGTPTVSRLICEHVLQCFGFPKAIPEEIEDIMSRIVLGNLRQYLTVTLTQFVVVSGAAAGLAIATVGVGSLIALAGCFLSTPPTARMLLKCAADIILILERSFRYSGKYVSTKQIEDAAKQYVTIDTTTFGGKEKRLQEHIRDEIDRMIPLMKVGVGFRFKKLRTGFEHIIYKNRFDRPLDHKDADPFAAKLVELEGSTSQPAELPPDGENCRRAELPGGANQVAKLPAKIPLCTSSPAMPELADSSVTETSLAHSTNTDSSRPSELGGVTSPTLFSRLSSRILEHNILAPTISELSASPTIKEGKSGSLDREKSSSSTSSSFLGKSWKSMTMKKHKKEKESK